MRRVSRSGSGNPCAFGVDSIRFEALSGLNPSGASCEHTASVLMSAATVNAMRALARTNEGMNGAVDGTRTHAWTLARSRTTPILRPPRIRETLSRHPRGGKIASYSQKQTGAPMQLRDAQLWIARNSALFVLADLKHARCLNDGRFPLPFSKFSGFGTVGVDTSKFFSVLIKNRNLPVFVLASSVFSQLGVFSFYQ